MPPDPPRVIGFAGWSGSGKTTLIVRLIPVLAGMGLRVSTIKHAHHDFDVDQPGKDSFVHRQAGAQEVLVSSARRWALMHELREEAEAPLEALLARLAPVDLVLVEGFKRAPLCKIEVFRPALGKPLLQPGDPTILAVASDATVDAGVPVLALDDVGDLAGFVVREARVLAAGSAR